VSSPTPTPTVATSPTPTPIGTITPPTCQAGPTPNVVWGSPNCGNADFAVKDTTDPDDYPGGADSYTCVWICAVDPLDPSPPHEVLQDWDFDPAADIHYDTGYLPCCAWVP
jgi:hypothetical protein